MSDSPREIVLSPEDIPGASLSKPYEKYTVAALRWWLLCRGVKAPTSWKKRAIINRVNQAEQEDTAIVDVDGSYLYRKYKSLTEAGEQVSLPGHPSPPLAGWKSVTEETYQTIAPSIPPVTSGLVYTYLAGHVGHTSNEGAFRALDRGYKHWASGRLQELDVNINHPKYCHVHCTMNPSMKTGTYHVYLLLGQEGSFATICSAKCECTAGKSASCTHVSAVLHALAALNPASFQLRPNNPSANDSDDEDSTPVTSLPCQWKRPKKRKESTLPISEATFEKHDYAKPVKKKIKSVEDFDPRPPQFRGLITSRLPDFLDKVRGEQLGISLLFDPHFRQGSVYQPSSHHIPDTSKLSKTIVAFKKSLEINDEKAREIERNTREQRLSSLWFSVRRYRITASLFGAVLTRRANTPPDSLVLRIIQPKSFSTPAIQYGIENEQVALKEYVAYRQAHGHPHLTVSPSGFLVSTMHPFLGASPDGAVYDPSNLQQPFGFLEIKCPYSHRNVLPGEACDDSKFCCVFDMTTGNVRLKETHQYYAQVQGQMGIGGRPWCDFVVYTKKGISVQRISFDKMFWQNKLLPKLTSFYDNCVAPEIVSPLHSLGIPLRNLSKE